MKIIEALNNALEFVEELGRELTLSSSLEIKRARLERELMQALMAPAAQLASAQAGPADVLGALEKRNIFDAIRCAYDLGYNDARNARAVPGDSAPGYDGRSVETDHGGALFNTMNRRLSESRPDPAAPAAQPVGEPMAVIPADGPSTYKQRFTAAVGVICGLTPPAELVSDWISKTERDGDLQQWVGSYAPGWVQNIAVLDAAHVMATQPTEGGAHRTE